MRATILRLRARFLAAIRTALGCLFWIVATKAAEADTKAANHGGTRT